MNYSELSSFHESILQANCVEDIFGIPEILILENQEDLEETVKISYRKLAKECHPDHSEPKEKANEVFSLLSHKYNIALKKIQNKTYGEKTNDSFAENNQNYFINTLKGEYSINYTVAQGDLATIYGGIYKDSQHKNTNIIIKVVEDPADNDLIQNEIRILGVLNNETSTFSKHIPNVIDKFKTTSGQLSTIMPFIKGYDLYTIREKYKKGIPSHHIIWIFRRVLSVLGFAHQKGIIHGNIDPSHILITPSDHNIHLIDWSYSIYKPFNTRQGFKAINEEYSAPEVTENSAPIPASDFYSLGKCMLYLLGGDINTNKLPDNIDIRIRRFINFFLRKSPIQRPDDAWAMYHELDNLREDIFGKHVFREFEF